MSEREVLEVDVLFVGGGAASLSGALRLQRLVDAHNARVEAGEDGERLEPMIAILEKGSEIGAHSLSGAVLDPCALAELVPDFAERDCPIEAPVSDEAVYFLTQRRALRLPLIPPDLRNHGNYVISLAQFNRWLGGLAEAAGVNVFPGFAAVEILEEDGRVVGVRTGDKGVDRSGQRKPNFEPGIDVRARVTIFGDGPRGYLSKQLIARHGLQDGRPKQVFETGVKEVIELPEPRVAPGEVIHTTGWPFPNDSVGGTWIYGLRDNHVSIGLAVPLDYHDPFLNPQHLLQRFKTHPLVRPLLDGGKVVHYGAKVISAGGYDAIPRPCVDGALIVGEAASLVNMARLKGIHLAMRSGMLAAQTVFDALRRDDFSTQTLSAYETALREGPVGRELRRTRHFHRAISKGFPRAFFHLGIQQLTGGRDVLRVTDPPEDRDTLSRVAEYYGVDRDEPSPPPTDGTLFLDKLADVYLSGTMHNEDQPCHLKVLDTTKCYDTCVAEWRYPCNRFCPAQVYEMVREEDGGALRLQVNFANCVHCQTCDIKCPMDNIRWTPPEGGDGPNYTMG